MLLALLIAGVACLVLGVVFASSPWLISALVVGALAAVLLYRRRYHIGRTVRAGPGRSPAAAGPAPVAPALVTGTAFAARGRPGRTVAAPRLDLRVWVVDGRPAYHLGQCPLLDDVPAGAVPERVPLTQAVEDGFGACPTCEPTEERVAAGTAAIIGAAAVGSVEPDEDARAVWVVDGRPRYHRPGCALLAGVPAEPIPRAQARTDGFTPCPRCDPDSGR